MLNNGCQPTPLSAEQPILAGYIPIEQKTISLNGDWNFSADPALIAAEEKWYEPGFDASTWQVVSVPHTWNVMKEYQDFIGEAWYRLDFLPEMLTEDSQIFLNFDAVYYKADVWLNGENLGTHEGGYTPFRFDVSHLLFPGSQNTLVVKVDNYRLYNRVPDETFDWWPYGGIVRGVTLEITNKVFITRQRITATPHLTDWDEADYADISTEIFLTNNTKERFEGSLITNVHSELSPDQVVGEFPEQVISIPAGDSIVISVSGSIHSPLLWHFDHPDLYVCETVLMDQKRQIFHQERDNFGIRSVELSGGQLLLNGEPVRLVGMTRHADSPEFGLAEPVSFMTADYDDMKRLNMVLSRPVHYPQDGSVLDYCDRNGILLIPEIPAWQIENTHLGNEETLHAARTQLMEMILSSYNHPSIWAWSVGNEIDSNMPNGQSYVEGLVELAHELDPTRPVGFASNRLYHNQDRDATALADFVLMNQYTGSWGGPKEDLPIAIDRIHELWPEKVVIISEFGLEAGWAGEDWMGDTTGMNNKSYYYIEPGTPANSETVFAVRSQLISEQMDVFRSKSFVAGAIFWTYQDYRSDMDFRMGLYDWDRHPSALINLIREQYSPLKSVTISPPAHDGSISVELINRGPIEREMPAYTLRGYTLVLSLIFESGTVIQLEKITLPDLPPSEVEDHQFFFQQPEEEYWFRIEVFRPTGFSVGEFIFNSRGEKVE